MSHSFRGVYATNLRTVEHFQKQIFAAYSDNSVTALTFPVTPDFHDIPYIITCTRQDTDTVAVLFTCQEGINARDRYSSTHTRPRL